MLALVHSVITWFGDVGTGSESSPLSVNSTFAEILRLVQVGIFAGVLYLIQGVKKSKEVSGETHEDILDAVKQIQSQLGTLTGKVNALEGNHNAKG